MGQVLVPRTADALDQLGPRFGACGSLSDEFEQTTQQAVSLLFANVAESDGVRRGAGVQSALYLEPLRLRSRLAEVKGVDLVG